MSVGQALRTAIRNLAAHKGRFAQAMLGMVVGVTAVVFVLGISSSLFNLNQAQEELYAPGLINARIYNNAELARKITMEDLERTVADNPEALRGVSPYVTFELPGGISYEGQAHDAAELLGVGVDYLDMLPALHLREGRFLDYMDMDRERRNCVVGSYIADELMGGDALGKTLKVWGENYMVVGIMQENTDFSSVVWIPYPNARKMVGETIRHNGTDFTYYMDQYFIWAQSPETMYEANQLIEKTCQDVTGWEQDPLWLYYSNGFGSIAESINGVIMGAILQYLTFAAIIVLVGGVGIMNVMLASVQARTREIGIRKAFGATNAAIRRQFTMEAVITSLVGGLLGLLLGFGLLVLVAIYEPTLPMGGGVYYAVSWQFMDWKTLGLPALLAFAISIVVGIIFGDYPAQQAAKMEPVAAINAN